MFPGENGNGNVEKINRMMIFLDIITIGRLSFRLNVTLSLELSKKYDTYDLAGIRKYTIPCNYTWVPTETLEWLPGCRELQIRKNKNLQKSS